MKNRLVIFSLVSANSPLVVVLGALGEILDGRPRLPAVHVQAVHLIRPKVVAARSANRQVGQRRTRRG